MRYRRRRRLHQLEIENEALRQGYSLLAEIANLRRDVMAVDHTVYAVLTGVTAGIGLGLNRAMVFLSDGAKLQGFAAVGPINREEADRVWRAIEEEDANLSELYEAGIARVARPDSLDHWVRDVSIDPEGNTVVAQSFRQERVIQGLDLESDMQEYFHRETGIAAPLMTREFPLGVLYADNRFTERPLGPVVRLIFASVANAAAHAIETARRYEEIQQEARTDPLTKVGNRSAMQWALEAAVRRAREEHKPLALAIFDIDNFKRVNDTFGHGMGDDVLRGVARRLRATVRDGSAFRFGGEEFVVLFPGAGEEAARHAAERLRQAISDRPMLVQRERLKVTCSVGVSLLDTKASGERLLHTADAALLEAKRTGKNRVVFFP